MERSQAIKDIYSIPLKSLEGQDFDLGKFKGKKMLIVNTASECGFTAQYAQLQELHAHFKDKVVVVGCPSNDFGGQEPGSGQEIAEFCQSRFGVEFPLTAKMKITGSDPHPLFAWLMREAGQLTGKPSGEILRWNFSKFLVDESGSLTHVFSSADEPLSETVLSALDIRF